MRIEVFQANSKACKYEKISVTDTERTLICCTMLVANLQGVTRLTNFFQILSQEVDGEMRETLIFKSVGMAG